MDIPCLQMYRLAALIQRDIMVQEQLYQRLIISPTVKDIFSLCIHTYTYIHPDTFFVLHAVQPQHTSIYI